LPSAFSETIKSKKNVKLLWQHDPKEPIGYFTNITETVHGLFVEGQITLDIARGREVYALIKSGTVDGLSIGFEIIDCFYGGDVRYVKKAKLWEISVVTFPANEEAKVKNIKSHNELKELVQAVNKLIDGLNAGHAMCLKVLK
jgi:HK97 family phage prohead protease